MTAGSAGGRPAQPTGTRDARVPLHRSRHDRVLAGVCGGIAETYGADPTVVRLLAAIIGIFSGIVPMLVLYLVGAVIIPELSDGDVAAEPAGHSRIESGQGALIFGTLLIVAGLAALANQVLGIEWEQLWPAALIAIGGLVILLATSREGA